MTATPGTSEEADVRTDPLDDVFGSAPASPTLTGENGSSRPQALDPSDVPRLRSTHVTNGYREGIAASKEKHIQEGFDEGYALGAELGTRLGWCVGVLQGVLSAMALESREPTNSKDVTLGGQDETPETSHAEEVKALLTKAEEELRVQNLFGQEYFGEDGIWKYDVPKQDSEAEDVTFSEVADAHPLVKKWTKIARDIAKDFGLNVS